MTSCGDWLVFRRSAPGLAFRLSLAAALAAAEVLGALVLVRPAAPAQGRTEPEQRSHPMIERVSKES